MELDEMKLVWKRVNQLLEGQERQLAQIHLNEKLAHVRSGLRPLFWGQVCQILFGVAVILLAVGFWTSHRHAWYQLACGIVLHVYGVAVILMAGLTLSRIQAIDYSKPVVAIRRRVGQLRSTYVLNGMLVGLPWWLLWLVVVVVLAGYGGIDLLAERPAWVGLSAAAGVAGLLLTWAFHVWAKQPARAGFGRRLVENAAGASLKKAQRVLDELRAFEQEDSEDRPRAR